MNHAVVQDEPNKYDYPRRADNTSDEQKHIPLSAVPIPDELKNVPLLFGEPIPEALIAPEHPYGSELSSMRSDLIKAQSNFIQAQTVYIHSHDLSALISAQNDLIKAQFNLLKLRDQNTVPGINEAVINLQIAALKVLGEV